MDENRIFEPISAELTETIQLIEKTVFLQTLRATGVDDEAIKPIEILLDHGCPISAILAVGKYLKEEEDGD